MLRASLIPVSLYGVLKTQSTSPARAEEEDLFADEALFPEFDMDLSGKPDHVRHKFEFPLKSRAQHLKELKETELDLLVIGGGCNGAGVVLDAASRGLRCGLVDAYDFGSGTSSRSTKLAHGGIRYLEQIVMRDGDVAENFELLKEAMIERNYFLESAPFINRQMRVVIPCDSWLTNALWNFPGVLVYHSIYLWRSLFVDSKTSIAGPMIHTPLKLRKQFEALPEIRSHKCVSFSEAQITDARQCMLAILTATVNSFHGGQKGANAVNYCEFRDFLKNEDGTIAGALLFDKQSKKEFKVKSKVVVNCAGTFADDVRKKANPEAEQRMLSARGTHLVLEGGLLPDD